MGLAEEFARAKSSRIIYKGREVWRDHQFPIAHHQRVRITIEAFDTDWGGLGKERALQGVGLTIDKRIEIGGISCRVLTIWPHSPPIEELRPPAEELHRIEFGWVHAEGGIKSRLCLWLDEPFEPVEVICHTRDGHIHIYNAWNIGHWWSGIWCRYYGSGMLVEEIENGFRYRCNDSYPDEDFNDIVFRIERCRD